MSTPQGPSGAAQGQPAQKPENRNGQEVPAAPGSASSPAAAKFPGSAASQEPTPKSQVQGPPASTAPAPADKPPVAKPAAGASAQDVGDKTAESPAAKSQQSGGNAGPTTDGAHESSAAGSGQRPSQGARPGGPTPPWQRGRQQGPQGPAQSAPQNNQSAPQNKPQTNVPGVGQGLGKPAGAPQRERPASPTAAGPSGTAQQKTSKSSAPAPSTRPVITGTAAPKASAGAQSVDRNAAKAKAAVIDGPTRHIERKDLAKDLPDLSSVKHPVAPVSAETPHASPVAVPAAASEPLRATVQVRRIDPWSMLKISSVISISLFFVWMIAVGLLYGVLAGMGVWERLNSAFTDIVSDAGSDGLITAGQVFGYATVIGLANTVLLTALATIGAFIYNLCTDLVGGVQVTLADPD